jgi:hypothetical protein
MSRSRLHRIVVRVDPALHEVLTEIAERLLSETRSEYSCSAVTRGLIALGLVAVADIRLLGPLFRGARVKRGRKRGPVATSPDAARRSRRRIRERARRRLRPMTRR